MAETYTQKILESKQSAEIKATDYVPFSGDRNDHAIKHAPLMNDIARAPNSPQLNDSQTNYLGAMGVDPDKFKQPVPSQEELQKRRELQIDRTLLALKKSGGNPETWLANGVTVGEFNRATGTLPGTYCLAKRIDLLGGYIEEAAQALDEYKKKNPNARPGDPDIDRLAEDLSTRNRYANEQMKHFETALDTMCRKTYGEDMWGFAKEFHKTLLENVERMQSGQPVDKNQVKKCLAALGSLNRNDEQAAELALADYNTQQKLLGEKSIGDLSGCIRKLIE